ncbi:MAG: ATP-dependent 6-phosphofructokinase [Bacillota bacterium]
MENERIIDRVMKKGVRRIGIMTGGGDCPGLNAVVRSAVFMAKKHDIEVIGIPFGYRGLYLGGSYFKPLSTDDVVGIIDQGGTILNSSNKDNLFRYPRRDRTGILKDDDGNIIYDDFSDHAIDNLKRAKIDAMIIVGGDGTLTSGRDYSRLGVPVVGVPKTIDNDLRSTDITFGFDTAVTRCAEVVECVRTTGEAHNRVMFIEVMGRNAGHIALHTALSTGADMVLIPEIAYDSKMLVDTIREKLLTDKSAIIIVSEGVEPPDESAYETKIVEGSPDAVRFGGVASAIAEFVEKHLNSIRDVHGYAISETLIDVECRATNVGYAQRGGTPTVNDRILSTRFGAYAVTELLGRLELDEHGNYGRMVAVKDNALTSVSLEDVISSNNMIDNQRKVEVRGEIVELARDMGISFGDRFAYN